MAVFRSLFLVVLSFLWTFTRGDTVSCVFMKSCILPCSFVPGEDVVIHWIQIPKDLPVHSYYHSKDQLAFQDSRFKGRTSLFQDQISKGNASLLLSNVQIQDEAKYKCYISIISGGKESLNDLNVEAPVNQIHFEQVGSEMRCSSEGIYPKPELRWLTNPPSNTASKNTTTVQQPEQLLYNISSSLILSHGAADVDVNCTISTSRNSKTATLFKLNSISGSDTETILCAASTTSHDETSIILRFNHSQVIVDHSGAVSEEWRPYVKVTDSGHLILQPSSSDQNGIYTCEVNNAEKTLITNTFLEYRQDTNVTAGVLVGLVVVVVLVGILSLYCVCKKRKKQRQKAKEKRSSKEDGDKNRTNEHLLNGSGKNGTSETPT